MVSITTSSLSASLQIKDFATKYTTVKWPIEHHAENNKTNKLWLIWQSESSGYTIFVTQDTSTSNCISLLFQFLAIIKCYFWIKKIDCERNINVSSDCVRELSKEREFKSVLRDMHIWVFWVYRIGCAKQVNIPTVFLWPSLLYIWSTRLFIWLTFYFLFGQLNFFYGQLDFAYDKLFTFCMVSGTLFMANSTLDMINFLLFIWSVKLFVWSTWLFIW